MRSPLLPLLAATLGVCSVAPAAWAAPREIPYTGRLELHGEPVSGVVSLRFAVVATEDASLSCLTEDLASNATCGLWWEEHANVTVAAGSFAVLLGSSREIPTSLVQGTAPFLAVAVKGSLDSGFTALGGRQRLGASPYALRAETGPIGPIGTIAAWHKSLPGVPALSAEWAECNGQVINDPTSPLHNQALPNLNGQARFLRGGTSSGSLQDDQLQVHSHTDRGHQHVFHRPPYGDGELQNSNQIRGTVSTYYFTRYSDTGVGYADLGPPVSFEAAPMRTGAETRPTNMSVVWIMRIK